MKRISFLWLAAFITACNTTPLAEDEEILEASSADKTIESVELTEPIIPTEETPPPVISAPPANVWDLLEEGYAFAPALYDNKRVEAQFSFLQQRDESLMEVSRRARLFLYYIYEELKRRNLPLELALLPALESTYDPYAYSPAGASGLWQFTRDTGHFFDLEENWWHSQRRDLEASTQAALDYLESLYNRYDNWELALAAYNAGSSRVDRAIAHNRRYGRPTGYWHLRLPRETQNYVPRLIAYSRLFSRADRAHEYVVAIPAIPYWTKVFIPQQLSFEELIETADLNEEEFFLLNAAHNQWLSSPYKDFLLIPFSDEVRVKQAIAAMNLDLGIQWMGYKVKRKEKMGDIAHKFGIDSEDIERFNNIEKLAAGYYLILPMNPGDINTVEGLEPRPPQYVEREYRNVRHRVRRGDTLWDISREYGVSVGQVMRWNNLKSAKRIHPGQRLIVAKSVSVDEPAILLADDYNRKVMRSVHYRVRKGDSLHTIADKFNVSINELRKWNPSRAKGRYIYPGQRIRLYVDVTDL